MNTHSEYYYLIFLIIEFILEHFYALAFIKSNSIPNHILDQYQLPFYFILWI